MRISDWSSDVCSSDLNLRVAKRELRLHTDSSQNFLTQGVYSRNPSSGFNYGECQCNANCSSQLPRRLSLWAAATANLPNRLPESRRSPRSEEHTSELQSLMRNSYAVFCLKKNK